jgi:hypothetical protein
VPHQGFCTSGDCACACPASAAISAVAARTPVKIEVCIFIANLQIHGDECVAKVPIGHRAI